ncbi:MAG: alpha amylase [Symploca sp. SIO3C6]|nr:alpha amylase [Symploca sp. SIO3C6]
MSVDLFIRKQTHFVLWRPGVTQPKPILYIGIINSQKSQCQPENFREIELKPSAQFPELWEVAAKDCHLKNGQVYFYWFKVGDTNVYESDYPRGSAKGDRQIIYCSDPTAWTVDRRFAVDPNSQTPVKFNCELDTKHHPASVVLYKNGQLLPCDPEGQIANWEGDAPIKTLPTNNQLVIYELPTRWTRIGAQGKKEVGIGSFRDVLSLLNPETITSNFQKIEALIQKRAYLLELGVNALELLPPADSEDNLHWGYGTANYFAADFHLGRQDQQSVPKASTDLIELIKTCHQQGLRFFYDAVMAFSRNAPYRYINFLDFHVHWNSGDPEQGNREAFGGDLFKYNYWVEGYEPITGKKSWLVPAREYMKAHIAHWINYYRVDGLRLDSVNNIDNEEFVREFKDYARSLWQQRGGTNDHFLVAGEELSVPLSLVHQQCLDCLWNEKFKHILRQVILGRNTDDESSFVESVRKLIDCRLLGFTDGTQAVNYITSHDVEGDGNERLYNYLDNQGIVEKEKYIKLAFVCLLTAVGIPMILAGEEFADEHDLSPAEVKDKQVDPVNYERLRESWRQDIFNYVARLVRWRTKAQALAVNDTDFIHVDLNQGKRVIVWKRGYGEQIVVVVANFSDYCSSPTGEYIIPNWPSVGTDKQWWEVTQDRAVVNYQAGKEAIFPWEAKVYALV